MYLRANLQDALRAVNITPSDATTLSVRTRAINIRLDTKRASSHGYNRAKEGDCQSLQPYSCIYNKISLYILG